MRLDEKKLMGLNFRNLLNDLKRRPEDAARELGLSTEQVMEMIEGKRAITTEIIDTCCKVWPVSPRDFFLFQDDCPQGVLCFSREESEASARVMERAGKPYYEYRDTAASRLSSFRPEWIKELCVVEDNNPENPQVCWNRGHMVHQFTYFLGPVNFYYVDEQGKKAVAVMNTGDSMYISPYVPHTFTTRKSEGGNGVILALTYGNALQGDTLHELRCIGREHAEQYSMGHREAELLRYFMNLSSMTVETLAQETHLSSARLNDMLKGTAVISATEREQMANALKINPRDLMTFELSAPKVVVQKYAQARHWTKNGMELREMASHALLSHSKSFEVTPPRHKSTAESFGLHQYIYCLGPNTTTVYWKTDGQEHSKELREGDSLYMKPFVEHSFAGSARLLSLRIPSRVHRQAMDELSYMGKHSTVRCLEDTLQWFKS